MSNYLLLRNNKESGPFTLEEIKAMSLKSYDLLWVVGKSAAWRYPGEIIELMGFAPPVPEQFSDGPVKKKQPDISTADSTANKKSDSSNARTRENNSQRIASRVYVNLPAEKKQALIPPVPNSYEANPSSMRSQEPVYDFSDLYKKQPGSAVRFSAKLLWVSTIILLFGTGILTGFFISDRRKFFSTVANHPQNPPVIQPTALDNKKEISPINFPVNPRTSADKTLQTKPDPNKSVNPASGRLTSSIFRKDRKNTVEKKDSTGSQTDSYSTIKVADSIKENSISKTESLYQKIKAHPENYLNLVTGRYSTGLFGGISSFPVTLTNNSPVQFDLVAVSIQYIQNNEKVFKTESLSFNDIEPGETVTLKAPRSPRGVKITMRIQSYSSRALELNNSN
jgi:hypothetical protein